MMGGQGEQHESRLSGLEHGRLRSLNPVSLPRHCHRRAAKLVFTSEPFYEINSFLVCWRHFFVNGFFKFFFGYIIALVDTKY